MACRCQQKKTNMMLFNAGSNPSNLPIFKLNGEIIGYSQVVKFLGVFLTPKLTWNVHIDYILTKARKSINFLKVISRLPWGMDTKVLIHLSLALVRSKLTYAQEAFFSASKYLLKRMQSLDCKGIKIALGVPIHASNQDTYNTAGILSLDDFRELATSKFVLRATSTTDNFVDEEVQIRSDTDFPKRAQNISSQITVATYTSDLIKQAGVNPKDLALKLAYTPIPTWEMLKATFDVKYTDIRKRQECQYVTYHH